MKNKVVLFFILLAGISFVLGIATHLYKQEILLIAQTWMEVAQTSLLFGIAWGVGNISLKKD